MPRPYEIVDANLHAALRVFGESTGNGAVEGLPGITVIDSGLDYAVFNLAVLSGPVVDRIEDFGQRLARANAYYEARRVRWSLWMCEDHIDRSAKAAVRKLILNAGFRQIAAPPGMIAESLAAPIRALPAVECRPVSDAATRLAFTHISAVSFDIPFQTAHRVYGADRAWAGAYRGWIGYVDANAVCCAATVVEAGAIGVYSVGTLPGFRRRGYAESLMRQVVPLLTEETGLTQSLLQASDAGEALYLQMGYRAVTRYAVYLL
ncbi:MAG: GNAT family N-acetyltransferase [Bryobacteraceae bacterium]